MVVDGDSMPHFGSKAKSASDTVGMVAIVPPLLPSARRGAPSLARDATPSLVPRHGEAAPRHRLDDLLGVSWAPPTWPSTGSARAAQRKSKATLMAPLSFWVARDTKA